MNTLLWDVEFGGRILYGRALIAFPFKYLDHSTFEREAFFCRRRSSCCRWKLSLEHSFNFSLDALKLPNEIVSLLSKREKDCSDGFCCWNYHSYFSIERLLLSKEYLMLLYLLEQ